MSISSQSFLIPYVPILLLWHLLKPNSSKQINQNFLNFLPFSSRAFVPIASGTHVVVDGGFLIQNKVFWKKDLTFGDIACSTVSSVLKQFGSNMTVVFDGYPSEPTTKDHADRSHLPKSGVGNSVDVTSSKRLVLNRETFLSNSQNKQQFINLISEAFIDKGINVKHAFADADELIASTVIQKAMHQNVCLIGEDTDLIVLIWQKWSSQCNAVTVQTRQRIWNIQALVESNSFQSFICLVHAFLGCDTTSRIFSIGKNKVLKDPDLCRTFAKEAEIFYDLRKKVRQVLVRDL